MYIHPSVVRFSSRNISLGNYIFISHVRFFSACIHNVAFDIYIYVHIGQSSLYCRLNNFDAFDLFELTVLQKSRPVYDGQ